MAKFHEQEKKMHILVIVNCNIDDGNGGGYSLQIMSKGVGIWKNLVGVIKYGQRAGKVGWVNFSF